MKFLLYIFGTYVVLLLLVIVLSLIVVRISSYITKNQKKTKHWNTITKALFSTNESKPLKSLFVLIVRHLWEFPQVLAGYLLLNFQLIRLNRFELFSYKNITTGIWYNSPVRMGISLGAYIFVWENTSKKLTIKNTLYLHEHGHTFDSRIFGPFYLLIIGLPSLISATWRRTIAGEPFGVSTHSFRWYEMRANQHAARMLFLDYGTDWDDRETYYPRQKRSNKKKRQI